jgi:hypothetical protein
MIVNISCRARFFPTQFAWPKEKGRNAASLWMTSRAGAEAVEAGEESDLSHRSGRNSSGAGEKFSEQR